MHRHIVKAFPSFSILFECFLNVFPLLFEYSLQSFSSLLCVSQFFNWFLILVVPFAIFVFAFAVFSLFVGVSKERHNTLWPTATREIIQDVRTMIIGHGAERSGMWPWAAVRPRIKKNESKGVRNQAYVFLSLFRQKQFCDAFQAKCFLFRPLRDEVNTVFSNNL